MSRATSNAKTRTADPSGAWPVSFGSFGPWLVVLGALLFSVVLRSVHLEALENPLSGDLLFAHPTVDAEEYHLEALRHFNGEPWQVPVHGPLHPWLLGRAYALFGAELGVARRFQLVIGLGSILLVFLLGRGWIGAWPAAWAAALLAMYRPALLFESEIYSEGLAVFLSLLALGAIDKARHKGVGWAALSGLLLGMLALTRTNLALALPLVALYFAFRVPGGGARRALCAATLLSVGLLPIAFVARANHAASGEWIPIQAQGGLALWMANHPGSDGTPDVRPGPEFEELRREARREGQAQGPSATSAYWRAKVWDFALSDPVEFASLLLRKARWVFSPREVPSSYDPEAQAQTSGVARIPLPGFAWLFPFAAAGFAAGSWRGRSRGLLLVACALVFFSLVFGFAAGRYRYQLAAPLVLGAALGILPLWRRESRAWIAAALALLLILSAPSTRDLEPVWSAEVEGLRTYAGLKRAEGTSDPDSRVAWLHRAARAVTRGMASDDEDPRLWFWLGYLEGHGDDGKFGSTGALFVEAEQRFARALELRGDYLEAARNRAQALARLGRYGEAAQEYQRVLAYEPWSQQDRDRLSEALLRSRR